MMKFDKFQCRIFPQFKAHELGEFPKENRDKSLISSLNIKINELVMDLFQLTDEEKQTVREFEV